MNRREIIKSMALIGAASYVSTSNAIGFGDMMKKGSSGGGSWKSIASAFGEAKANFLTELSIQSNITADIAEALDLQSEAAVMRAEAEKVDKEGDSLGAGDFGAIGDKSESTNKLISEKLSSADNLTDDQKSKLGDAAKQYVPSLLRGVLTGKALKDIISDASGMGTPGFSDGMAAVSAAKDIPVLAPAMVSFLVNSITTGKDLVTSMGSKGVATPEISSDDFADFV